MVRGIGYDWLSIDESNSRSPPVVKIRWLPCQCGSDYFLKKRQYQVNTFRPIIWRHRFTCVKCDKDQYSNWKESWSTGGAGVFLAQQRWGEAVDH